MCGRRCERGEDEDLSDLIHVLRGSENLSSREYCIGVGRSERVEYPSLFGSSYGSVTIASLLFMCFTTRSKS